MRVIFANPVLDNAVGSTVKGEPRRWSRRHRRWKSELFFPPDLIKNMNEKTRLFASAKALLNALHRGGALWNVVILLDHGDSLTVTK